MGVGLRSEGTDLSLLPLRSRSGRQATVKNAFIRGSVVRYVQLPGQAIDTQLLEDATRRGAWLFLSDGLPRRLSAPRRRADGRYLFSTSRGAGRQALSAAGGAIEAPTPTRSSMHPNCNGEEPIEGAREGGGAGDPLYSR
jgi:hypothetical protein